MIMATFYQHDDEVIEAARILKRALLEDSPFGNEDQAQKWLKETYPQVVSLAAQTTVDDEPIAIAEDNCPLKCIQKVIQYIKN